MRLRGRTVGDVEDDEPSVASTSSRSMDENSSSGAVLGSPVTRRSWSATHDSQESSHNPAPVATSATQPSPIDQRGYESDPQTSREQQPYLTDYETATYTEHEVYPTTIWDAQGDLYSTSPPQTQTQTHHPEEPPAYVQTTSAPAMTYDTAYITNNPQTPIQSQLRTDYHPNPYYTPYSGSPTQAALQHTSTTSRSYQTQLPQLPARSLDYGEPANSSYFNYEQRPQAYPHPGAPALTIFPPFQSRQLHEYAEAPSYLQTPASEPLTRYVTSDNEESWSPAAQTNPETHKRRISEADETVDGFRHNKMRTELDEIEERGEGSQTQGPRKRRRRRRGSGKRKGRSQPRSRSKSRDRGNGDGYGKGRNRSGDGGSHEGMRS